MERVLPDADRQALDIVKEIAKNRNLQVVIYDVSTFKGRFIAALKGVKRTPTIIIGKQKIEEVPNKEQLLNML
jgi:hypothetical protein